MWSGWRVRSSPRLPGVWQAAADAAKNSCPNVIAEPGVNAIGDSPASRNVFTPSDIGVTPRSSYSGNVVSFTLFGQSGWIAPNQLGNTPIVSSGECHHWSMIPLTGASPSPARISLNGPASARSTNSASATFQNIRFTGTGIQLRNGDPPRVGRS